MSRMLILVIGLFVLTGTTNARLPVMVLYEALCPDSIRFMQYQLGPSYNSVKDYIDILLVPFGKASSVNGGEYFTCQHGPAECDGNMMQACVLNHLQSDSNAQVEFAVCQMTPGVDSTGQVCAEKVGVPFSKVQQCISSGLGKRLLLEAEVLTKSISPKFIPTVVYNDKFNQRLQDRSQTAFKSVLCELLNNAPPTC